MELVTVTLTVPRQYLPSLYRVCADLNSKANHQESGKGKDRHRNRPGNIAKNTMKSVKDLTTLSRKTSDPDVKRVLIAAVEKLTSDVASSISATEKVGKWLDVADAVVEEQQLVETAKVAVAVGRAQDVVDRQVMTREKTNKRVGSYHSSSDVALIHPTNEPPTIYDWSAARSDRRTRRKPQNFLENRSKIRQSVAVKSSNSPQPCKHLRIENGMFKRASDLNYAERHRCVDCLRVFD